MLLIQTQNINKQSAFYQKLIRMSTPRIQPVNQIS